MGMRIMSREETMNMIRLAGEVHRGTRELPLEIKEQRKKIEAAIRNGELWMARLHMPLPNVMVLEIVDMKLTLDSMYGMWATNETPTLH